MQLMSADYFHYVLRGGCDLNCKDRTVYLQTVNEVEKDSMFAFFVPTINVTEGNPDDQRRYYQYDS